ncbi:hypothetical protein C8N35_11278 [Breoghania corrubedonensis]|uniref:Uncharacterized protein n=1 Tax=Breoghania corrubedonensis TaxID=665038 RepID=A0A2T5UW66_9HYPH|nr:hypothetical protein [Breoghania corrubedonensis]PTW55753.1 hypothetical protein C8N35_11278 [Breoghania corrubedonensis]
MFDNINNHDSHDTDNRLRNNLRLFDRDSLKILHPLFRDALRLLAHRHQTDKRETRLLPLVRLAPPTRDDQQPEMFPVTVIGRDRTAAQPTQLHH